MDKITKGTLVDFLFPTSTTNPLKKLIIYDNDSKIPINHHNKNISSTAKQINRSRCLKANQMNSSVVIWDQRILQKDELLHQSVSPQKNFNIKRIKDVKKLGISIEKIVKMQLKKRQKLFNFDCHRSFSIQNSKPIQKMVVTAQSKKRIQIDQNNIPSLQQQQNPFINQYLYNQKKQLKDSKYILSETQISLKTNYQKESLEKIIEVNDFQCNMIQKKCVTSPRKSYSRRIQEHKKYQQMVELQRKQILQLKKELSKNYAKPFSPPQNISAYSYIIYQANAKKNKLLRKFSFREDQKSETRKTLLNSYKVIACLNSRSPVQIASLTKIMTCILTLDLSTRFKINISEEYVLIGLFQQNIGGTSANILKGQIYTVQQLLYGLMLPSGNDASLALAVWGGKMLLKFQFSKKCVFKKKDCYQRFIIEMSRKADKLNMQKTKYVNSHGLSNCENKSCPYDLALLCEYSMNNPQFRQIVSCKIYETVISMDGDQLTSLQVNINTHLGMSMSKTLQMQQMKDLSPTKQDYNEQEIFVQRYKKGVGSKAIRWQSPHQLLQTMPNLYIGIKTGITDTAGPCLSSCFQVKGRRFIVIVLNCRSMKYRFKDTENLRKWLFKKEQINEKQIFRNNECEQAVVPIKQ